ncbi:MAG TPA: tetratricopeptide repeat protein [Thermoanaerobaculia bacterium]|nr:tetratricopeptide repeat protein [Thermoanaerobaculia bacterium]
MNEHSKLVPFGSALRRPDPARVAEFAETARRLQRERAVSEDVVSGALRSTPRASWARLSERSELHTSGALERLGQEVELRRSSDPREALAIAEIASRIADALPNDAYPSIILAQLRAHAWKDRSQALSYLGRYDEALRALDRAEAQIDAYGTLAHDRAMVRLCRATLLQHLRRFDEAQSMLDECGRVFRSHGDEQTYVKCTLALGNLMVRRGDYRAARAILAPLVTEPSLVGPHARMALGWCAIHLGAADEAIEQFDEAAQDCRRLGRELETVRANYGSGSAMLRLHRFREAIAALLSTREIFLSRGLVEEGGLSGLGIVEAHLVLGQAEAARQLAASLVREFSAANLNRRAVAALAYLSDAIVASNATPAIARDVHTYIVTLQTDPNCEFARAN